MAHDAPSPTVMAAPTPLSHGAGVGKTLHLDCFSGIAGDMLVAALLDLGVPREAITQSLDALDLDGYTIAQGPKTESSIVATRFVVTVTAPQPHRTFRAIRAMLEGALLPEGVRQRAVAAFRVLAEAEGRIHRMPPDEVHFHEVGAVDAIVDIVAASAALDWLGARVVAAPVPMSHGFVRAAHGMLPVPAPAVVEILSGVPTYGVDVPVELVTPTGAALLKANATAFARWPAITPRGTGFGAGTRTLPGGRPNLLRVVLGDSAGPDTQRGPGAATHSLIEANLDDVSAQVAAHVTDTLLREGALDAWATPVTMKKGRPGVVLSALAHVGDRERLGRVMLRESPSLGVRFAEVHRAERPRRVVEVSTAYGVVAVKVADGDALPVTAQPEFEVCKSLAAAAGVPLREVQAAALSAFWESKKPSEV
ncbi:MAG: nickel pincer cofactor biosynthesis protein LarC [Myxococcales bacterium]|nr:nickel pincer cofactor biosynthesis protein LarC [Myxococcales bacterium]